MNYFTQQLLLSATEIRSADTEYILIFLYKHKKNRPHALLQLQGSPGKVNFPARTIFRSALQKNCPFFSIVHNHPSGKAFPSQKDYITTEFISLGADLLQLQLLDHVIVTADDYFSFREAGIL